MDRNGYGAGVFTEMTAKQKENLTAWLRELNGEALQLPASEPSMPYIQEAIIEDPKAQAEDTVFLERWRTHIAAASQADLERLGSRSPARKVEQIIGRGSLLDREPRDRLMQAGPRGCRLDDCRKCASLSPVRTRSSERSKLRPPTFASEPTARISNKGGGDIPGR